MSSSSTRAVPEMFLHQAVSAAQICNSCIAERQLIASLRSRFGGGGTDSEALLRNNGVSGPASRTKAEAVYSLQGGRYLVYKPPNGSPRVAKDWFKNGRACPVHARTS
ncbi:unnamed protein product [Tilletia controversa]|nr:unnamed protein product [Tilletia controversa]